MTTQPLSATEQARLDATNLRAAIHDGLAAAGWSFGYRTIADIVVNLPALQRLTQQTAEVARLRETVARVQALADELVTRYPDAPPELQAILRAVAADIRATITDARRGTR
jgi:hypothetical protein